MSKSVEMKWRKLRLYTKTHRLFSRKYQVLIEEVFICHLYSKHYIKFYIIQENDTTTQVPTESEVIRTDADTVKELVEMKFLAKRRNIRFRTPTQRLIVRNSQVLIDNDATTHVTENV